MVSSWGQLYGLAGWAAAYSVNMLNGCLFKFLLLYFWSRPTNAPGKAAKDIPRVWAPGSQPDSGLAVAAIWRLDEWMDDLFLSVFSLSLALPQINK